MTMHTIRIRRSFARTLLTATIAAMPVIGVGAISSVHAQQQEAMSLDEAVAAVRAYEFGESREALTVLADYVTAALHDAHLGRDDLETALLTIINDDDATNDGRRFACRQLARVGTPAAAESLEPLLLDDQLYDVALQALMHINDPRDPRSTMVLLGATDVLEGPPLHAVIHALGARGNAAELLQLLQSINLTDPTARLEAMKGAIPADPAAIMKHLQEFEREAPTPRLREEARRVIVDCGRVMVERGMGDAADLVLAAYDGIDAEPGLRQAVMNIRVQAMPDAYGMELLDRLEMAVTFDHDDQIPAIIAALATIEDQQFFHTYSRHVHDRSPEIVAAIIEVTRRRRGELSEQLVLTHLARSTDNPIIALPALHALGDIGTARCGPILINIATTSPDDSLRAAARDALASLPDAALDPWLGELVSNANASYRRAAVESLAARHAVDQVRAILVQLRDERDPDLVVSMSEAAATMVGAEHVTMIIDAAEARNEFPAPVLTIADRALARCLVAALNDAKDLDTVRTPLLLKIRQARESIPGSWLIAAANLGGDEAYAMFQSLRSGDKAFIATAALQHWPNTRPIPDLMTSVTDGDGDAEYRQMCAMSAIRLLTKSGSADAAQRLAWARTLLEATNGTPVHSEAVRILGRLGTSASLPDIVEAIASDDPVVTSAAADALLDYSRLHGATNAQETLTALNRVKSRLHADDTRISRVDEAMAAVNRARSYIHNWTWTGPFDGDGAPVADQFDMAFPPESSTAVQWQPIDPAAIDAPGVVDLARLVGGTNRCVYLRAEINSHIEGDVELALGSDDGLKVWFNGEVVHENNVMRGHSLGSDVITVSARKGMNILMLKVTQGGGDWKASCRFVNR